jgi:hypothetical protein
MCRREPEANQLNVFVSWVRNAKNQPVKWESVDTLPYGRSDNNLQIKCSISDV